MATRTLTTNYLSRLSNARSALPLSSSEATERSTASDSSLETKRKAL